MSRVFLSHSSKDKGFVEKVAELFGKDRCVYDKYSFESGMKNIDEIMFGLDNTDIFVYFISEHSLESEWVQTEINNAEKKLNSNKSLLSQIYPIIIDKNINYSDSRIAMFLKKDSDSYNLRHIEYPKLAYKKISSQIIRLLMEKDINFSERTNHFYGRDDEISLFKKRYDDFSMPQMKCLVVSGIEGIGRFSYIKESLRSARIIKDYYTPIKISMKRNETIEDLIIKISDTGFSSITLENIKLLRSMDEKIELLTELLLKVQNQNEYIVIYDDMCLLDFSKSFRFWFEKALGGVRNEIVLAVATNVKLDYMKYRNNHNFYSVELVGLKRNERAGLLRSYSNLEKIDFTRDDIDFLIGSLTGYPPQVKYCVELAKENSVEFVRNSPHKLVEFSSNKASEILSTIIEQKNKELYYAFLSFLSKYGLVPVKIVYEVLKINPDYKSILNWLRMLTICRYEGASNEYIRVNSVIEDYIQRMNIDIPNDISEYLRTNVEMFNKRIDENDYTELLDYSEINYYIKENLKEGKRVPEKFLYSTIYLKTIIELYNDKKSSKVVSIIEKIRDDGSLQGYDEVAYRQITYYYCLALTRLRDKKFHSQVDYFKERNEYTTYNFLMGYYYRTVGNFKKAEEYYLNVLGINNGHKKAKRELVYIYTVIGRYDEAFELARLNYKEDPENIYQMQAYFDCLVRQKHLIDAQTHDKDVKDILTKVDLIHSNKAIDGYYNILSNYYGFIENDKEKAIEFINRGIKQFKNSIYLSKSLFDICEKFHDIEGMKKALELLNNQINGARSTYKSLYISKKILYDAYCGNSLMTLLLEIDGSSELSSKMKDTLKGKVRRILSKTKQHV